MTKVRASAVCEESLYKIANKHNLYVTCGSDYHGRNKKTDGDLRSYSILF